MLRSMYSAISGMQGFETKLDTIGNNIANVNTVGFKAGRVDFSDVLSQTMTGGSAPSKIMGGTNPQQVGLGVKVAAIQTLFTQGADQSTGNNMDLAINGQGLFIVKSGQGSLLYTRAGDFDVDSSNNLVLPNGAVVMGFQTKTDSSKNVVVDESKTVPVNLDSLLKQYVTSLGTSVDGTVTYSPGASNTVGYSDSSTGASGTLQFSLSSAPDVQIGPDGSVNVTVEVANTTGTAPNTTTTTSTQRLSIGNLALATVANPAGLEKVGDSMYQVSNNSGQPTYQVPGENNTGAVQAGYLEMSNVDLTREFTEMIVAQRGFDANSKIIGTDNSILQDIVNLKNG